MTPASGIDVSRRSGPTRRTRAPGRNRRAGESRPDDRATAAGSEPELHALVVVADSRSRAQCRQSLEDLGFAVALADDGVGAVMAARARRPDVVLIGAQLPDGPGLQAMEWLRSNPALEHTPAVLVSTSPEDAAHVGRNGIGSLLRIPTSEALITRAVRRALRHRAT